MAEMSITELMRISSRLKIPNDVDDTGNTLAFSACLIGATTSMLRNSFEVSAGSDFVANKNDNTTISNSTLIKN